MFVFSPRRVRTRRALPIEGWQGDRIEAVAGERLDTRRDEKMKGKARGLNLVEPLLAFFGAQTNYSAKEIFARDRASHKVTTFESLLIRIDSWSSIRI